MEAKQLILLAMLFIISLYIVLRMIITFRLREVYAVIWVLVTLAIPLSVVLYPYIEGVSTFLGIPDPFYLVVFAGFLICFILLLHFSALNSGMQRSLKNAIQKIAILEEEIRVMGETIRKNETNT
jgi:hypothetical protein